MGIYDRDWYRNETPTWLPVVNVATGRRELRPKAAILVLHHVLNVIAAIPLLGMSLGAVIGGFVYFAGKHGVTIMSAGTRPPDAGFWEVSRSFHTSLTEEFSKPDANGLYTSFIFYNSNGFAAAVSAVLFPIACYASVRMLCAPFFMAAIVAIVYAEAIALQRFGWTTQLSSWPLLVPPAVLLGGIFAADAKRHATPMRIALFTPLVGGAVALLGWGVCALGAYDLLWPIGMDLRVMAVAFAATAVAAIPSLPFVWLFKHTLDR